MKKCLFIADEDISQVSEKISNSLKGNGILVDIKHIDLRDEKYYTGTQLDFEKIKSEINSDYMNQKFDLVACDFIYAKDPLDGFNVIKWIKNEAESKKLRIRKAKFILYSSEGEKLIQKTNTLEEIKKLIHLKIEAFYERTNLVEGIIKQLSHENNDLMLTLVKEIEKYSDLSFKSTYLQFKGKKLAEIANEIELQSHHGTKFTEHMLELLIAHMIELNNWYYDNYLSH